MNNYTQGKMTWKCRKDGSLIYIIGDPNIGPHAQGDIYIGKDDLRHMAACWNACSGSKTETLELVGSDYIKPLLDLLDQRDELLAALEGLHKVCEIALAGKDGRQHVYFETRGGHFVEATNAMRDAESAIAKVKVGGS